MPIYEYACHSCTHRFETIQKAAEDPLRDCPECGEPALKKLLSAPVFRLKGGGWYETDFKTGDKRNVVESGDAKGDAPNGGDGGGGGEEAKKDASATTGESKTKPAGDAAASTKAPVKGSAASDGKSGAAGGKTDAARGKPKSGPKPSG